MAFQTTTVWPNNNTTFQPAIDGEPVPEGWRYAPVLNLWLLNDIRNKKVEIGGFTDGEPPVAYVNGDNTLSIERIWETEAVANAWAAYCTSMGGTVTITTV